ncbi:MAG TPA: NAD(P)/FAD-dependent oxidoreductase [Candidatus Baltobacteraceae bacterium]|nr:NAD(P)/FAD-dependent oxidoreductase [Candidatus Baltobacteraceae bacterium]
MLIVGGGPAGLASAIAARAKGLRVTVVDSRKPPIDKACGEGLLPEGVAALENLGVDLRAASPIPFAGIRFSSEHFSASAQFERGTAFGLRRTALHKLLFEHAASAGVAFAWGARLSAFDGSAAQVNGEWIGFRWLIGADGQQSIVRRFANLGRDLRGPARFGFRRHYAVAPWTDLVEVHWGDRCQMVVTPTGAQETCISLFTGDFRLRIDDALRQFPLVARRLRGVQPVSALAGAITSLGRARAATRHNIALVGDASGAVDGIAGQGLSLAFGQAQALGEALGRGDLALYASAHRRIMHGASRMTRLLLLMNASAAIRRKALRLFATHPSVFARLMSVHAGEASSRALNPAQVLGLGWRVLCS